MSRRRFQYLWQVEAPGPYTIMCRAFDTEGNCQPQDASWNKLGYGNSGVNEHAIEVQVST